jgi:hypothetical protein
MAVKPLIIWRFRDGKPGHEQQSLGLVKALGELLPVEVNDFDVREHPVGIADWMLGRFPAGLVKRRPDFLIGAGHATHVPMLAAKKAVGGKIIVLMKPSLPAFLFDLVIVPEHDGLTPDARVIVTRGALNAMRPGEKKPDSVLILLGGESKHARWDDDAVLRQVTTIVAALKPGQLWRITDSRRTPEALSAVLAQRYGERFQPWAACPPGWLAQRLAGTETVWVSEDSASMIYEALSAGCRVGVIELPDANRSGRVLAGVAKMADDGQLAFFSRCQGRSEELPAPTLALNEAGAVAHQVLERFLADGDLS